jgi:hypothetical protein
VCAPAEEPIVSTIYLAAAFKLYADACAKPAQSYKRSYIGEQVTCNALLLAEESVFFTAKFTNTENYAGIDGVVDLPDVDGDTLETVVEALLKASIKLDNHNIERILHCADMLQVVHRLCQQRQYARIRRVQSHGDDLPAHLYPAHSSTANQHCQCAAVGHGIPDTTSNAQPIAWRWESIPYHTACQALGLMAGLYWIHSFCFALAAQLSVVKEACCQYMRDMLDEDHAAAMLSLAAKYSCDDTFTFTSNYIVAKFHTMKPDALKECTQTAFMSLITREDLSIHSELQVLPHGSPPHAATAESPSALISSVSRFLGEIVVSLGRSQVAAWVLKLHPVKLHLCDGVHAHRC